MECTCEEWQPGGKALIDILDACPYHRQLLDEAREFHGED